MIEILQILLLAMHGGVCAYAFIEKARKISLFMFITWLEFAVIILGSKP